MNLSDAHDEAHRRAAEAAAAYRAHEHSATRHRVSFEDEAAAPEPQDSEPAHRAPPRQGGAPRVLVHRIDAPFGTAFFAALGWSAGRALFRLVMLLVMLAILFLFLWRIVLQL